MKYLKKFLKFLYTHNLGYYVKCHTIKDKKDFRKGYTLYKKYILFGKILIYYYAYCESFSSLINLLNKYKVNDYELEINN